jgi:hypothetical protein
MGAGEKPKAVRRTGRPLLLGGILWGRTEDLNHSNGKNKVSKFQGFKVSKFKFKVQSFEYQDSG